MSIHPFTPTGDAFAEAQKLFKQAADFAPKMDDATLFDYIEQMALCLSSLLKAQADMSQKLRDLTELNLFVGKAVVHRVRHGNDQE